MVIVTNKTTGEKTEMPIDELALRGNEFTLDPGQTITVADELGSGTISVPAIEYLQNRAEYGGVQRDESTQQWLDDYRKHGTVGQQAATVAEGAASGLTLGLSDLAASTVAPDYYAEAQKRRELNPLASMAGEGIGMVAPALLTGGGSLLAKGGLTAGKAAIKGGLALGARTAEKSALRTAIGLLPAGAASRAGVAIEGGLGRALGQSLLGRGVAAAGGAATETAIQAGALAFNQTLAEGGSVDAAVEALLTNAKYGALFGGAAGIGGEIIGAGLSKGVGALAKKSDDIIKTEGKGLSKNESFLAAVKSNQEVAEKLRPNTDVNTAIDDAIKELSGTKKPIIDVNDSPQKIFEKTSRLAEKSKNALVGDVQTISAVGVPSKVEISQFLDDVGKTIDSFDDSIPKDKLDNMFEDFSNKVIGYLNNESKLTYNDMWAVREGLDKQISSLKLSNDLAAHQLRNRYDDFLLDQLTKEIEANPSLKAKVGDKLLNKYGRTRNLEYINQLTKLNPTDGQVAGMRAIGEDAARKAGVPTTVGDLAENLKNEALGKLGIPTSATSVAKKVGQYVGAPMTAPAIMGMMGADRNTIAATGLATGIIGVLGKGRGRMLSAMAMQKIAKPSFALSLTKVLRETATASTAAKINADRYDSYIDKVNNKKAMLEKTINDPTINPIEKAVAQKQLAMAQYLQESAPVGVGQSLDPLQPQINQLKPNPVELRSFSEKAQIVEDPMSILQELHSNTITVNHVDALEQNYPYVYEKIQEQVFNELKESKSPVPNSKRYSLGILLKIPTTYDLQHIRSIQEGFLPVEGDPEKINQPISGNIPKKDGVFKLY